MAELLNEKIGIFQLSTISWNLEFDKEIVVVFYHSSSFVKNITQT